MKLFGKDYLMYVYSSDHGMQISKDPDPRRSFTYDDNHWEASFADTFAQASNSVSSAESLKALSGHPLDQT